MMIARLRFVISALALAAISACATAPTPPDLAGAWRFRVDVSADRVTLGEMRLQRADIGYTGELTTNQGPNVLPVQSLTLTGDQVALRVISPDGAVTFDGRLDPSGDSMDGVMTYHNGQRYPMRVERAKPA